MKHASRSRTVVVNSAVLAGSVAALGALEAGLHVIQADVPSWVYLALLAGVSGVNVWLRTVTSEPVRWRRGGPDDV